MAKILTRTIIAALAFVVDLTSVVRGPGKPIDWAKDRKSVV